MSCSYPFDSAQRTTSSQCCAHRSPNLGDFSSRSTTRSYAPGLLSARYPAISWGVGGSPVRSKVTRRISVGRSAWADNESPPVCSRATMNESIGLLTLVASILGTGGELGFLNAQWEDCAKAIVGMNAEAITTTMAL